MSNWENSTDIEEILDKIRINSINLNRSHMKNYFYYKCSNGKKGENFTKNDNKMIKMTK